MKKFLINLFNNDIFLTVILALLLGMFLGVAFNSKLFLPVKVKFHDFYSKINPNYQKDSQTLIIEKVTKDTPNINQKDIFEEPKKKNNSFILFIKRIFTPKKETNNIHDFILN